MARFLYILFLLTCLPITVFGDRSLLLLENGMGIETIKSEQGKIKLALTPQSRCFSGDWDLLVSDQRVNSNSEIIVSIESITKAKERFKKSIEKLNTGDEFETEIPGVIGLNLSVTLPKVEKKTVAGLYICSTKDLTKGCNSKQPRDFETLFKPHAITPSEIDGKMLGKPSHPELFNRDLGGEKIYFFRYIIIHPDGTTRFPTIAQLKDDYRQLKMYQEKSGDSIQPVELELKRLKSLGQTIGSIPLEKEENMIKVTLPFYDKAKCIGVPKG